MILQIQQSRLRSASGGRAADPAENRGSVLESAGTAASPDRASENVASANPAAANCVHRPHRVGILIESSNAYGRGLLVGVHDHLSAGNHDRWITFLPEHGRGTPPLKSLASWRGDGLIARIENEAIARAVEKLGVPTIDVSGGRLLSNTPFVETDDAAIARLAATHFQEMGFRHVGFYGDDRFSWSRDRSRHFAAEVAARGMELSVFEAGGKRRAEASHQDEQLVKWLAGLPKPVAVFACYDVFGARVIDACRRVNLRVPSDVAVLGVDDDELLCPLSTPQLSSITPDARGAGRLAAELLDQLLSGAKVAAEHLLPPRGVAIRQSTDFMAVNDPVVAAAVQFIRENISKGVKVEDVATAVHISRRVLEQRFIRSLSRTPHDEILRVQFQTVQDLLKTTDHKLAAIARRCGFRHPEYMTAAFTKRYGRSPSEWRRMNQT